MITKVGNVKLTPSESKILDAFLEKTTLSQEDVAAFLPTPLYINSTIDKRPCVHIHNINKKIKPHGLAIKNNYGTGYTLGQLNERA